MTLKRLVFVLASSLVAMLAVVMLRAENRRLHYHISQHDLRADALTTQIHEKELELARLSNPRIIRERVAELRLQEVTGAAQRDNKSSPKKRPSRP